MKLRWRKRRDLAERLRPYLASAQPSEPMVDADPIRMFLFRWMIETGDPIEVVAKGFDLDAELLAAVLSGDLVRMPMTLARGIRLHIGVDEPSGTPFNSAETSALN